MKGAMSVCARVDGQYRSYTWPISPMSVYTIFAHLQDRVAPEENAHLFEPRPNARDRFQLSLHFLDTHCCVCIDGNTYGANA